MCSALLRRPSENMLIRANTDGTYSANWTPGAVGLYTIHVTIDGIEIGTSSHPTCALTRLSHWAFSVGLGAWDWSILPVVCWDWFFLSVRGCDAS